MGPGDLSRLLKAVNFNTKPELLVGTAGGDDAAVYRLGEKLLVQTVDFFPPVVDTPASYGRIAAANALSDIYAMGGRPLLAMNIAAFPCELSEVFAAVLQGGAEKVEEAGAVTAGGHSIDDKEPKYGLVVTGLVEPAELKTNTGAAAGDRLILTKPIGFGVLATALKRGIISEADMAAPIEQAATLNKAAAAAMRGLSVDACTDVTGFGLIGHLAEMLPPGGLGARLNIESLPIWERAVKLAADGCVPGGTKRNYDYFGGRVKFLTPTAADLSNILFDPQTSGGLLMAVKPAAVADLLAALAANGVSHFADIGEVSDTAGGKIEIG